MLKELHFHEEVSVRSYLNELLASYPYDIDKAMVFTLLDKTTFPHPILLSFLAYFSSIGKIHILTKSSPPSPSLQHLWEKMSCLLQRSGSVSHVHQFSFDATYRIKRYRLSHPYAHLALSEIPFLCEVQLHSVPVIAMSERHTSCPIQKSEEFLFRNVSLDASSFLGICIHIGDRCGIVYLSNSCLWFAAALAAMYPISEPSVTYDFLLLFGLRKNTCKRQYYYDQTNSLYIGFVSGDDTMLHFLYLKEMILTLYNAICIQKHDLPIHASMAHVEAAQDSAKNLVFAGASYSGKSELLDAVRRETKRRHLEFSSYYDDSGILHYLDNKIVSTGSEVSACKDISFMKKEQIFSQYSSGLFLKEGEQIRFQITPLTTYESSLCFYPVHALFYLNAHAHQKGIRKIEVLEDAISLFQGKKQKEFFCGTLAAQDHLQESQYLLREFFTILYIQNIPVYEVCTRGTPYQKQTLFDTLAKAILAEILPSE